jgi:hypothetical protein
MSNTAKINIAFNQPSRATEVVTTTIPGAGGEDPLVVSRSVGGGAGTPGATGATGATGPAGPAGPIGPEGPPGSAEGAFLLDQDPPQNVTGFPAFPSLEIYDPLLPADVGLIIYPSDEGHAIRVVSTGHEDTENGIEFYIPVAVMPDPDGIVYLSASPSKIEASGFVAVQVFNAGETLGGNRAVKIHSDSLAYYVSADVPTDIGKACGITTGAATVGNSAIIQRFGLMTEPSWTWVPGPVYVGVNGALTQTPPVSGFIQPCGEAITATSIFIQPMPAIQLAA